MEWNSLPHTLRDPARSTDDFRSPLKLIFTRRKGTTSALEALRDALYELSTTITTTITSTAADFGVKICTKSNISAGVSLRNPPGALKPPDPVVGWGKAPLPILQEDR